MADFQIKVGDRLPGVPLFLLGADGEPLDITTAEAVRVRMWTPHRPGSRAYVVDAAPVIVDAATGSLRYDWAAGETSVVGEFAMDVVVTWPVGRQQTFPTVGWVTIEIADEGVGSW